MKHLQIIRVLLPDVRHQVCETNLDVLFANFATGAFPAIRFCAGNRILAKIKLADLFAVRQDGWATRVVQSELNMMIEMHSYR